MERLQVLSDASPSSSQSSDQENRPLSQDTSIAPTSSPLTVPSSGASTRPKRPANITPRRFNRFWNPLSSRQNGGTSRRQHLNDITASGANRGAPVDHEDDLPRSNKRRKLAFEILEEDEEENAKSPYHSSLPAFGSSPPPTSPLKALSQSPVSKTRTGYSEHLDRGITRAKIFEQLRPKPSLTQIIPNFRTRDEDLHRFGHFVGFCTAACHTNSLIAIGDEGGDVRILETTSTPPGTLPPFSSPYLEFRPHHTAVVDLAFSADDLRLASASGDQSARITDMRTQTTLAVLKEHKATVKQVAFQPGNEQILATCARDGLVAFWDLRCHARTPQLRLETSFSDEDENSQYRPKQVAMYSGIRNGHGPLNLQPPTPTSSAQAPQQSSYTERASPSITSCLFLPHSPRHLVTSTDANTTLRLWDIRSKHRSCHGAPTPLSYVSANSYSTQSIFGVKPRISGGRATTSLTMSASNPSKLYQVCKDSSIYVYATSHLLLGQQPSSTTTHRPSSEPPKEGLGPLYALRDPGLRVSSFYVRASVREAQDGRDEMLAVGSGGYSSSQNSTAQNQAQRVIGPVVFPTDESALRRLSSDRAPQRPDMSTARGGHDLRSRSANRFSTQPRQPPNAKLGFPVYENAGTVLRGGHSAEVTDVCWTSEGSCVSVGDDFRARVWREGAEEGDSEGASDDEG
ncbi:MAG: hypothetical protein M1828_005446 [Chrysothrix sp. TS-e1954]|nr:MAG: hypothetical protein M1828_005446 [Chrysothrix sp. TS-e1954]